MFLLFSFLYLREQVEDVSTLLYSVERERDFHDELEKVGRRGFEKGRGGGRRKKGEGREYREMSSGPLIDSWGRLPRRDKG